MAFHPHRVCEMDHRDETQTFLVKRRAERDRERSLNEVNHLSLECICLCVCVCASASHTTTHVGNVKTPTHGVGLCACVRICVYKNGMLARERVAIFDCMR